MLVANPHNSFLFIIFYTGFVCPEGSVRCKSEPKCITIDNICNDFLIGCVVSIQEELKKEHCIGTLHV